MDARYDWLSQPGQRDAKLRAIEQGRLDDARYYAALVQFAESETGQILLANWINSAFWKEKTTAEDWGEFRWVQKLLGELQGAVEKRQG
jgi:hypothetical protein